MFIAHKQQKGVLDVKLRQHQKMTPLVWLTAAGIVWASSMNTGILADYPACNGTVQGNICCLCSANDNCTLSCPEGFNKIFLSGRPCSNSSETRETTLEVTPTTTFPTSSGTSEAPYTEDDTVTEPLCLRCEENEYFDDNSTVCRPCSPCGCNSSSSNDCQGKNQGGVATEDSEKLYVYIGVGVGVGLALLLVVVVVVVCVCKKRCSGGLKQWRKRSAMSQIIELNYCKHDREDRDKPKGSSLVNKENMGNTQPFPAPGSFAEQVQEQSDNILRYTKDPTVRKPVQQKPEAESEYANMAMVRLQQKMDLTHESVENINRLIDEQEVKDLGEAPKPPGLQTPVKKSRSKVGIMKRLSQRMSKKLAPKGKTAKPTEEVGGDYIDMDSSEAPQQEDYENMDVKKDQLKPEEQQEVYESMDGENNPESVDLQQEDYENIKVNNDPKTSAKNTEERVKHAEKADELNKAEANVSDLEDYENIAVNNKDGMEDYENTSIARQQDIDKEIKVEEQEDYEIVELNKQSEESPYVNYNFSKKK